MNTLTATLEVVNPFVAIPQGWDAIEADDSTDLDATDFTLDPAAFDEPIVTPTHPDAYEPTLEDEVAETAYQIGLEGELVFLADAFPEIAARLEATREDRDPLEDTLDDVFYRNRKAGLLVALHRQGYAAGLAGLDRSACPGSKYGLLHLVAALDAGITEGAADRADLESQVAEMEAEADAIEWEGQFNFHNAEVENHWHHAEVAECGMGSRLVSVEGGGW